MKEKYHLRRSVKKRLFVSLMALTLLLRDVKVTRAFAEEGEENAPEEVQEVV